MNKNKNKIKIVMITYIRIDKEKRCSFLSITE